MSYSFVWYAVGVGAGMFIMWAGYASDLKSDNEHLRRLNKILWDSLERHWEIERRRSRREGR